MAQTQASQEQPPQPVHLTPDGLGEQPLLVLHFLHSLAHAPSQATEQQDGIFWQTQTSQVQPPQPLPVTALQPSWTTPGSVQVPEEQVYPDGQYTQGAPATPQAEGS